jgi:hypothetical protein
MKKLMSTAITTLLLLTCLFVPVNAAEGNAMEATDLASSQDYVANQATLDALYQEHLDLRDDPAELSEAQKDLMLAMGVEEERISQITNGEVADLLKTGAIIRPEYLIKHVDEDALVQEIAESKAMITELLEERGLDETQIDSFFEKRLVLWDYEEDSNDQLLADLARTPVHVHNTSCHIFSGDRAEDLLGGEPDVHYHKDSFPSVMTDSYGDTISIPKQPAEGTVAYTLKCDLLAVHLDDVSMMVKKLYGPNTGTVYNYNLWTEETSSSSNRFHVGVDVYRNSDLSLYSIINGTIIQKVSGSSSAPNTLSKLLVYNSTYDVTIQYLHGNWSTGSSGSLGNGVLIGTQDDRGAENKSHTHIQIMDGYTTLVPDAGASIGTLKPYAYFWAFCR